MLNIDGGGILNPALATQFPTTPAVADDVMFEQMRSALGRRLPHRVGFCHRHDRLMSVAGGGPSLADTWRDLSGVIVTANASLGYLLEKDVTPWGCGIMDPRAHMADVVTPHKDVFYFVASCCHPRVFDRLKDCTVILWHPTGTPGTEDVLAMENVEGPLIGGASTMGLRWINLGYVMGFRRFDLHGLDSSFRTGTHAYPDHADGQVPMLVEGFRTSRNFIEQVRDFFTLLARWSQPDIDPMKIEVRGDGLLQSRWRRFREMNPEAFA